jgi:hypothetical protein
MFVYDSKNVDEMIRFNTVGIGIYPAVDMGSSIAHVARSTFEVLWFALPSFRIRFRSSFAANVCLFDGKHVAGGSQPHMRRKGPPNTEAFAGEPECVCGEG